MLLKDAVNTEIGDLFPLQPACVHKSSRERLTLSFMCLFYTQTLLQELSIHVFPGTVHFIHSLEPKLFLASFILN